MFIKLFKLWLQHIQGKRAPNFFWYTLNSNSFSSYLDTPWGKTYQKFCEYNFWIDDDLNYSDWLTEYYWDEYEFFFISGLIEWD